MHPVLLEIPLPHVRVALAPALLVVALVGAGVAAAGRRLGARDLFELGLYGGLAALVGAIRLRGESIEIRSLPIYAFGAFLCAALAVGWVVTERLAARDGLSREVTRGAFMLAALGGILGARVLYVLTNLSDFHSVADAVALRNGGMTFYGGLAGGLVCLWGYARRKKGAFLAFADSAAPGLALGAMLGRVGCYLVGCDYGVRLSGTAPRWLVRLGTFPRWPDSVAGPFSGSPAWLDQVVRGDLPLDSQASLPVHPVQLYEAFALGLIACTVFRLHGRRSFKGHTFVVFAIGYAGVRFMSEWLRGDPERGFLGPHAAPAWLLTFGLVLFWSALAAGPFRTLAPRVRWAVNGAAPLVAVVAFTLAQRYPSIPAQLSASQWLALGSVAAASAFWRRASMRPAPPASIAFTGGGVSS